MINYTIWFFFPKELEAQSLSIHLKFCRDTPECVPSILPLESSHGQVFHQQLCHLLMCVLGTAGRTGMDRFCPSILWWPWGEVICNTLAFMLCPLVHPGWWQQSSLDWREWIHEESASPRLGMLLHSCWCRCWVWQAGLDRLELPGGNGSCWGNGSCSSSQDCQRSHGGFLAAFPLSQPIVAEVPREGSEVFLGRTANWFPSWLLVGKFKANILGTAS